MMKNLRKKTKNGISLIVLVITIIVMIILATAIILSLSNSGIIGKANKAKTDSDVANLKELTNMFIAEYNIEPTEETLKEYIIRRLNENNVDTSQLLVNEGGQLGIIPEEWDKNIVTPEISTDGIIVPIPKGFVASSVQSEKAVNNGLVIYEGTSEVNDENLSTSQTTRNQYVWVPIENSNAIVRKNNENYRGVLYDFDNTNQMIIEKEDWILGTNNNREPDNLTGTLKISDTNYVADSQEIFTYYGAGTWNNEMYQKEFDKLAKSIIKYGGFYVGRYEASSNNQSKRGKKPTLDSWHGFYNKFRNLYAENNNNYGVVSSMIWGCQWDNIMIWMKDIKGNNNKNYIFDSSKKGYFSSNSEQYTGSKDEYSVKNIFDMAGNVFEWTQEARSDNLRVARGGAMFGSNLYRPAEYPASKRFPSISIRGAFGYYISSRIQLYIKI